MRSHLEHALAMNQLLHFPEELERIIGPSAQSYDYGHDENKGMEPVAADIKETAKGYVFYADVPGLTKSDIQDLDGINTAHILDPICFPISEKQESLSSKKIIAKRYEKLEVFDQLLGSRRRMSSHGWFTKFTEDGFPTVQLQLGYQDRPCPTLDKYQLSYNWAKNPFVRKAIHAQSEEITGEWKRCTPRFKYNPDVQSVVEYHQNLTRKGYRALIYSGDHDLIVPFIGTEAWIRSLNYTIIDDWRSWLVDRQIAGYTRLYDNHLTFATVKGGGHTAPEYRPRQAFVMFERWSSGEPL